jgi:hypothetical protein
MPVAIRTLFVGTGLAPPGAAHTKHERHARLRNVSIVRY